MKTPQSTANRCASLPTPRDRALPLLLAAALSGPLAALPASATSHMQGQMPGQMHGDMPAQTHGDMGSMSSMPMHSQMRNMREMMNAIESSEDPAERQRLMHEHMESMRGMMQMMHGMMAGQAVVEEHRHDARRDDTGNAASGYEERHGGGAYPGGLHAQIALLSERLDALQLVVDQLVSAHRQMLDAKP